MTGIQPTLDLPQRRTLCGHCQNYFLKTKDFSYKSEKKANSFQIPHHQHQSPLSLSLPLSLFHQHGEKKFLLPLSPVTLVLLSLCNHFVHSSWDPSAIHPSIHPIDCIYLVVGTLERRRIAHLALASCVVVVSEQAASAAARFSASHRLHLAALLVPAVEQESNQQHE